MTIRINYVELRVASTERAKAFYGGLFGWTFTDYGPDYTEFSDGEMKGGFDATAKDAAGKDAAGKDAAGKDAGNDAGNDAGRRQPGTGPLVVLYSDTLDGLEDRVKQAGGSISRARFDFPGGQRFHFLDPDGNELAIWSP